MASLEEDTNTFAQETERLGLDPTEEISPAEETTGLLANNKSEFEHLPAWRRPSSFWLMPILVAMSLAMGAVLSPTFNLVISLVCRRHFAQRERMNPDLPILPVLIGEENRQCQSPEIMALVSRWVLLLTVSAAICSAIISPKIGALSDRFGRTKLLVVTSIGLILDDVAMILSMWYPDILGLEVIIAGSIVAGCFGSFTAVLALANSYATDCTAPERRNVIFGYNFGCFFLGMAIGPSLGGLLVKLTNNLLSAFYAVLGVHISFFLYMAFVVPESLAPSRMRLNREQNLLNPKTLKQNLNFIAPLRILLPDDRLVRRNLLLLAIIDAIMMGFASSAGLVIILYAEQQFGWGTADTGFFLSAIGSGRVVVLLIILPVLTRIFGQKKRNAHTGINRFEITLVRIGLVMEICAFVAFALARNGTLYYAVAVLMAFGGLVTPNLVSGLTKTIPKEHVGQLLGAVALAHGAARVIAPTIMNLLFSFTAGTFPQAVFVFCASVNVALFVVSLFLKTNVYLHEG